MLWRPTEPHRQRLAHLLERLLLLLLPHAHLAPQLRGHDTGHDAVDPDPLLRQLLRQPLRHREQARVEGAADARRLAGRQRARAGRQRQRAAGGDDVVARGGLAADRGAPELDAEEGTALVEVGVGDGPADDLVDAGEDEVVDGRERAQELGEGFLVAHVADLAGEVGVVSLLDHGVDLVLGRGDDCYVSAVLEKRQGCSIANTFAT